MSRAFNQDRRRFLRTAATAIASASLGMLARSDRQAVLAASTDLSTTKDDTTMRQITPKAISLPVEGELPSFDGAIEWLNSQPSTPDDLRGKVVLVEFWTYTCINWMRTMPYVRAWSEKYQDQGLVVIGFHTPEFPFEHDLENVRRAVKAMRIAYPVAIDSDYTIWHAFDNHYWPAVYFVDAMGHIRHHVFGEGEYARSEQVLQQLLAEAGVPDVDHDLVAVEGLGPEAAADWNNLNSPETYLGYLQTERFASPGGSAQGSPRVYSAPTRFRLNEWALSGNWTVEPQSAVLNEPGGRIAYRLHARDLHLVVGPPSRGETVQFCVLLDGQAPGDAHGFDVDEQGNGTVAEQRLYQLIRQPAPIVDRLFEIEFLDQGAEAFAFTFG